MNYFTSKFIIKSFQPSYFLPTLTRHYDNVSQVFMKCGQSLLIDYILDSNQILALTGQM